MDVITGFIVSHSHSRPFYGKLVVDEGKIAALVPAPAGEKELFIFPGFIDSHTHPVETGLNLLFPDLSTARSVSEILEILADALIRFADSPVLFAFNFEPERLKEHRYLYRREVDRLTKEKPILIYRIDGHSAIGNSKTLALLEGTPEGIELDGAGKPTGVIRGKAYENISQLLKRQLPPELITEAITLASRLALSKGITTMAGMVGFDEMTMPEWARLLDAVLNAPTRIIPFLQTWQPEVASKLGLNQIGGCLLLDGSFGSNTAAIQEDYADAPGYNGILYRSDKEVIGFLRRAIEYNLQTAFHAIGDRAITQLVNCHEQVIKEGLIKPLRHRIEHAELLTGDLVKRIGDLKLILAMQPAFETIWGGPNGMYARRLGKRWMKTNRFKTLLQNGILIAGGSDSPVTPLDPIGGIRAAMSLPNVEERLTGEEALSLFTNNAAYSLGMETKIGTLQPGLEADFVLLDADPRIETHCQVLATYRQGKVLWKKEGEYEKPGTRPDI